MILRFETRAAIPLWRPLLILALATCYAVVLLFAGGAGNAAGASDHWLLGVSWQQTATESSGGGPAVISSDPRLETAAPAPASTTVPTLLTPVPAVTPMPLPSTAVAASPEPAPQDPAGDPPRPPASATPGPPSLFNGNGHRADRPKSPKGAGSQRKGGGKP